jgi:hypothetical protein
MESFILVGLALLVLFAALVTQRSEPEVETYIITLPKAPPRSNPLGTIVMVIVIVGILAVLIRAL